MARAKSNGADRAGSVDRVTISVPVAEVTGQSLGYEGEQAAAGRLSLAERGVSVSVNLGPKLARRFLEIRQGLRGQNEKLSDERPVFSNADVLRWLLEQSL